MPGTGMSKETFEEHMNSACGKKKNECSSCWFHRESEKDFWVTLMSQILIIV